MRAGWVVDEARAARPVGTATSQGAARRGVLLAAAAVSCISIASVCVRWAAPVPSVEIAFWRLLIAALAVLTAAGARWQWPRYRRGDLPLLAGIGLVTAVHFLSYIAAIEFTTIAHTLALIYTAPLFVAGLAVWWLRERPRRVQVVGMVVTIAGVAILTGFEPTMSARMAFGDGLALVSAVTLAVYSIAGRALRGRYPLLTYTTAVYGTAALWLLPAALAGFDAARYTPANSLAILALGLVPLGLGHTLYNAALRHVPAVTVNTIATQEVTLGVLLAWLLLAEAPGPVALLGVAVTLAGVVLVLRD